MDKVEFDKCKAIYDSGSALLIMINDEKHWIPHSQIHDDSEVYDANHNNEGKLVISEFIANKRGLI